MFDVLPDRVAWFVVGPALGLLVVAMFAVVNQPLGATSAYAQTAAWVRGRPGAAAWRVWYFAGLFVGGLTVSQVLRADGSLRSGYDALRDVFPLGVVTGLVFAGAVAMGYGAGLAGGCTSGHGICGTAQRSPASFAVTASFMAAAVVTTFILRVSTGGAL